MVDDLEPIIPNTQPAKPRVEPVTETATPQRETAPTLEPQIIDASKAPTLNPDVGSDPTALTPATFMADEDAFEKPKDEIRDQASLFERVLEILQSVQDLGIDSVAKQQMQSKSSEQLPQMICYELLQQKVINKVQLARALARANQRLEIMSFLDVPNSAFNLREDMEGKAIDLLRRDRIVPLAIKEYDDGDRQIHLAHENSARDLVLESALKEHYPGYRCVWHFILREVAGAFWLAGENDNIDSGMEAEALLDRIVGNAIDARSSDIHIDPSIKGEPRAMIKYRIDGMVHPKEVITLEQLDRLRVRIENLARMPKVNLSHTNKGAFTRSGYDWRVQIQPHAGRLGPVPRLVLRRLQPEVMGMEELGYPQEFIQKIKQSAAASNGVIFWTGPTGSGKTESIHSAVVSVDPMGKGLSVHTIEDPPEKRVPGYAIQMEMAEDDPARTGLQLLKSSLRADPDVIIFGEVRDKEMAQLTFDAANTGHLVFTTLHTNTSVDAIVRLDELGMHGFMLSYVRGIAAQRLIRRLCVHCREKMPEPDEYTRYVFDRYDVPLDSSAKLYTAHPDGCANCSFTGYYGRIAAAEWLQPNKEIVEASKRRDYEGLEDIARRAGWKPMGHMGVLHVKNGITDAKELSTKILELSSEML